MVVGTGSWRSDDVSVSFLSEVLPVVVNRTDAVSGFKVDGLKEGIGADFVLPMMCLSCR